jgi:6-pyruvoyltetrahydropterin/6-carboxytetrahydropterin synthase
MLAEIATEYEFCAAHYLPFVPEHHKCRRLHGHNYKLRVIVSGEVNEQGMVLDFFDVDAVVKPLLDGLVDHRCLNDVEGLENPTAENIAAWFVERLTKSARFNVVCRVYETPSCYAEVAGMKPGE